jgi:hypothetical protein
MNHSRAFVVFMFILAILCAGVAWWPFIAYWLK